MGIPGRWPRIAIFAAISMALVVPCWWQPRIQAGDLSSHVYNAWLAGLVERGAAPGLTLASQSTNVLFDLMLGRLFRWAGPGAAQRLAVSAAVWVFIWGAFAYVSAVSGREKELVLRRLGDAI